MKPGLYKAKPGTIGYWSGTVFRIIKATKQGAFWECLIELVGVGQLTANITEKLYQRIDFNYYLELLRK